MKAVVLTGSSREHSYTAALAWALGDALSSAGVEPRIVGATEVGAVPSAGSAWRPAEDLLALVREADAVVLVSPVYHGGYSALLKAALDGLPGDAFVDKPVAVAANGSGPRTGNVVCEQLRTVAKAMGGWVVPTQAAGCPEDFLPGEVLPPRASPELGERCRAIAAELQRFAALFRTPAGV
ncbi:NADPH-dependent FMN reductase [Streptacidiphilus melanogenes]|uniref:NADPH-dependent FMN reductase n=1 Tax=Streptacidiphilus melanogenes TaxID=411235 RepID=UPI0006945A28|nr:NADPH-dependent FMN reductase [Streptacidiphilus melanogenes]